MIPYQIHFIYGLKENFLNKPFSLFHNLAIKSAKFNNNCEIIVHLKFEPDTCFWEEIKPIVTIDKLKNIPEKIHGKNVIYFEHVGDLLRLEILKEEGGIYIDLDTIILKSFLPLLTQIHSTTMGLEVFNNNINGLCNAVIISEKNSEFINLWIESYREFNPNLWNKLSVEKPYEIYNSNKNLLTIKPYTSFFPYDWHNIIDMFNSDGFENSILDESFSIHLWESKTFFPLLRHITEFDIKNRSCLFNSIVKKYL